ncbi:MAG: DUF4139 domain-containing protein [Candidatus Hydrogenedentes bacterium]|nr:DUF4139 domain-containing protein [Candidatus Hydrogenedentota bacterium]
MVHRSGLTCLIIAASCCMVLCGGAHAQSDNASAAPTITKVSLFKNGLGYFNTTASLPSGASTVRLGQLPVPVFGTFWVEYPQDLKLGALITAMEDVEESVPVQNLAEYLKANAGKKVTLYMNVEGTIALKGTLLPLAKAAEPPSAPSTYVMGPRPVPDPRNIYVGPGGAGDLLLLQTDTGTVALSPHSVSRVEFEGEGILNTTTKRQKRPSIRVELNQPANGEAVSINYLARGITWAPGYKIDLSDPTQARLTARALIINEVADLDNVKVELITGYPNIAFSEVLAPEAMTQLLADFLASLASGGTPSDRGRNSVMAQQAVVMNNEFFVTPWESIPGPAYSTAAAGTRAEDLFMYPLEHVTLKKGETAWLPLFAAELPYKHIYTWSIDDTISENTRSVPEQQIESRRPAEEVWHCCRIVNKLSMPLTTAPAEFTTDGAFTGQDICYYTAPGADTTIRMNRAMNVLAEQAEVETSRRLSAATFNNYPHDLVQVRGELKLQNRQDKAVTVEITKAMSGEVLDMSPEGKDVKTATGLKQINPKHNLTWTLEVQPGEEKVIAYNYEVYVRS